MKTVFWLWAALLLACTISYLFMVLAWLVLGAVVAPETLLPYCTAVVTLGGHIQSTLKRLTATYRKCALPYAVQPSLICPTAAVALEACRTADC